MQIGVIGLSTMGANLARNAARNGATVALFNRTSQRTDLFVQQYGGEGAFVPTKTLKEFVAALPMPRVLMLMVKSDGVDEVLAELVPLLKKDDIVIDGGNSQYRLTEWREKELGAKNIRYVGMGVSGGEEGALKGPSMMPGGDSDAVETIMPLLQKMAAQDGAGGTCVTYIGPGGSGHFVKMVHNGIEYAAMQLIAEAYHLLGTVGKMTNAQIADLFSEWNAAGNLSSFLMEVSIRALRQKDAESGESLVDLIKDISGQKGTGKWTAEAAFEYGVSVPSILAAVDARIVSSGKDFRMQQAQRDELFGDETYRLESFTEAVRTALELSVINAYAQGFQLLSVASQAEGWELNIGEICRIWRGGCIIRSNLLPLYQRMFAGDTFAADAVRQRFGKPEQLQWRHVVALGALHAIPLPAMAASLSYYDAYRTARLPQNLIAAQRDIFGAHGYERLDKPGSFHTEWEM